MSRDDYVEKFRNAPTEGAWNDLIREVKRDHGGEYPSWWYDSMIASGIVDRKAREFGNQLRFIVD